MHVLKDPLVILRGATLMMTGLSRHHHGHVIMVAILKAQSVAASPQVVLGFLGEMYILQLIQWHGII